MRRRADMEVYFRPDEERPQGDGTEDGAFPRPPSFPPEVLERHGARMLRPTEAVRAPGTRAPQPTAYRAGILLVPDDLVRGRSDVINRALGDIGLRFAPPPPPSQLAPGLDEIGQYLRDLPRPVALRVREDGMPTDVDAWVALQHLRAVAGRAGSGLRREDVDRISLDHLLIGSAITGIGGSPVTEGSGIGSYVRAGSGGRCPVDLAMPAPYRRHLRDCGTNRRPVVAVLDTGIRSHPWLDVPRYGDPLPANGFVRIDPALQALIRAEEEQVAATSLDAVEVLVDHWDTPATSAPLVGTLDSHLGHGTFIAGIVRQVAPDAEVLAIRIMHSDGVVYEKDLILALKVLAARQAQAQARGQARPEDLVDIIVLSLGYFHEAPADEVYTSTLAQVLDELGAMGVLVVAAAGNYATSRPFFPAALAGRPKDQVPVPVLSVGALNPDGTVALFSNDGSWVRCFATGAAIVSTFPTDVNGSRTPAVALSVGNQPPNRRRTLDPDNFRSGFAVWSGTSFAAPLVAAYAAAGLLTGAAENASLSLDAVDRETTIARINTALQRMR